MCVCACVRACVRACVCVFCVKVNVAVVAVVGDLVSKAGVTETLLKICVLLYFSVF